MPLDQLFALATNLEFLELISMSSSNVPEREVPPQQTAWRLFLTVHALAYRWIDSGLLAKKCVSFDDYDVLLTLHEAEDETLRMSELAEAVLLSNSGMSRRVARLVERGLLHRAQCPQDGRVFRVRLTKSGRKALDQAWSVYSGLIEDTFANHVTATEGEMLGEVFQRILDRIGTEKHRHLLEEKVTDKPKRRL
jgi:DNA-binding MarR family transcriptional regulator